jgi:membrane protease YdiL (CAAX protease family)
MKKDASIFYLLRFAEIFLLFVSPVLLLYLEVVPLEKRFWLILFLLLYIVSVVFKEKWGVKELGFRTDNIKTAALPYLLFTTVGVVGIVILALFLGKNPVSNWWQKSHFLYGFLLLSFIQELGFRGFLIPRLKSIFNSPYLVIGVNGLLFAFIHVVFPNAVQLFPLGIVSGVSFATIYYYYPNLYLVTLSHAVMNFLAVLFCFFSFQTSC